MPIITVVIGEGGSGGAIAIATANRILMLEHAIYTVASPEAAASILWRDSAKAIDAATNMKITAQDLEQLGVIDVIIREPVGGAHRDREQVIEATGDAIARALAEFDGKSPAEIRRLRHERFLEIGRRSNLPAAKRQNRRKSGAYRGRLGRFAVLAMELPRRSDASWLKPQLSTSPPACTRREADLSCGCRAARAVQAPHSSGYSGCT